jgi:hypothetical protein
VVTVALNSPTFAADEFEYAGIKPIAKKPASVRLVSDRRFAVNQTCINVDLPLNRSDL